ncbi:MAG: glutaredoxin [Thermoplasmata archaeon]|nr:MAG: glutaredoxin [Thermoplasmata archaeon]
MIQKVSGEKTKHKIKCYTISTCGWCKKTKAWLKSNKYEYEYIDVDLLQGDERDKISEEVKQYNEMLSFPTVVIDEEIVVVGHDAEKLKEALGDD